jgi:ATP-binding cassette subfamily B protein
LFSEYALSRWRLYAFAFLLMAIAAGATALTAYLVGTVINQAYADRNFAAVAEIGLLVMFVFTLRGAAVYGHSVILSRIGNNIVAENQRRLFSSLQRQNLAYFAQRHSSELITRLTVGAAAANQVLSLVINAVGRDLLTLVSLVGVMVYQDPLLSIISFVVAPPAAIGLRKLAKRVRTVALTQWRGGTQAIETLQEMIQGIRIVKSLTLEPRLQDRFQDNVAALEAESNKMARVSSRMTPLMDTLGGLVIASVLIYAGYRIIHNGASPGAFFSFMTAFLLAYEPAKRLTRLNLELNAALVNVRILFEVIDAPATEPADQHRPDLKVSAARVEFSRVNFSYRTGELVLRNMSFVAEAGRMTALVGPSGGGKSTILNLLLRFYDATSGAITIDDHDITTVSLHSLRSQISYVGQDVFLFRTTIRENIAFGHPNATDEDIVAAAKAAHAHDFIMASPNGYDTMVGERGTDLSGGERQRISIARALVRNAPLILLDEATAALDSESESHIQRALAELCKGRTTLVVAHRLSTIMHADRILVIEAGQVTEAGRHEELLRKAGRYASFYRLQLQQQHAREPLAAAQGL